MSATIAASAGPSWYSVPVARMPVPTEPIQSRTPVRVLRDIQDLVRFAGEDVGEIHEAQAPAGAAERVDAGAPVGPVRESERLHHFFGGLAASRIACSARAAAPGPGWKTSPC